MTRGMILGLILTLGLLGGSCVAGTPQPWDMQQGDDSWVANNSGAFLGVGTQDITHERAAALKLKDETGVEIVMVDQDAPAAKAGIKEHDILLTFNGARIDSAEQLRRVVRETPPGRTVAVGLLRNGQPVNVSVVLADRKEMAKVFARKHGFPAMPPIPHPDIKALAIAPMMEFDVPQVNVLVQSTGRSGVMVEGITPQLAEYFGCKDGASGVLVRGVEKGSPGEAAGLRAGDIIVMVDKEKISDPGDWRHALHGRTGAVALSILRDKKDMTLTLTLPEHKRGELELPKLDLPKEDIENAMRGLDEQMEDFQMNFRPMLEENAEQFKMIAHQLKAPDGEIRKELERAREEVRKAVKECERISSTD